MALPTTPLSAASKSTTDTRNWLVVGVLPGQHSPCSRPDVQHGVVEQTTWLHLMCGAETPAFRPALGWGGSAALPPGKPAGVATGPFAKALAAIIDRARATVSPCTGFGPRGPRHSHGSPG